MKPPKGTRDFSGKEIEIKNYLLEAIRAIFIQRGARETDTPCFELADFLTSKFCDTDEKLIYYLNDFGGEKLALRYDQTMSLMRYIGNNNKCNWKRFQIGKVWRRDKPNVSGGRWREFTQADFDIIGNYDNVNADFEVLSCIHHVFKKLKLDFMIRINWRYILEGLIEKSGISKEYFQTVSSSIDKLDKISYEEFKRELYEKNIQSDMIEKLQKLLLESKNESWWLINRDTKRLKYLIDLCQIDKIVYDPTLARGLDYYTGFILEVNLHNTKMGSFGGGGRYDNLIGNITGHNMKSVGFSIGIDRLVDYIIHSDLTNIIPQKNQEKIFIFHTDNCGDSTIKLSNMLLNNEKYVEYDINLTMSWRKQMEYALKNNFKWIVTIDNLISTVKNLESRQSFQINTPDIVNFFNV